MFEIFLDRSIKYPLMYIIVLTVLAPDQWRLKCGVIHPLNAMCLSAYLIPKKAVSLLSLRQINPMISK